MSTKNSFITGNNFYVFKEIFEEVCISKETWKELKDKISSCSDS